MELSTTSEGYELEPISECCYNELTGIEEIDSIILASCTDEAISLAMCELDRHGELEAALQRRNPMWHLRVCSLLGYQFPYDCRVPYCDALRMLIIGESEGRIKDLYGAGILARLKWITLENIELPSVLSILTWLVSPGRPWDYRIPNLPTDRCPILLLACRAIKVGSTAAFIELLKVGYSADAGDGLSDVLIETIPSRHLALLMKTMIEEDRAELLRD